MTLKSTYLSIGIFFLVTINSTAQVVLKTGNTTETPQEYYLKVKQFGEFIDRFNYVADWKGNLMGDDFKTKVSRAQYINYLIDEEDIRLKKPDDSSYHKLCGQFIASVTNPQDPQTISLYSGQVVANADVKIEYLGRQQNIKIMFVPEILGDRSAKWVIGKVEAGCFKNMNDSLRKYFIAPNSHETSFINLKRIENLSNPLYFFPKEMNVDPTLLFMTEVAAGRLTIKTIEKVSYAIKLDGWEIKVEEFIRDANNSGWLISNIEGKKQ